MDEIKHAAKTAGEGSADALIDSIKNTWRQLSELASTRVNDVCATMTTDGLSDHLIAEYRKCFIDAFAARLDSARCIPSR